MERTTQTSSMLSAKLGKSSLTSMPLCPYFLNLKGEGNAAPVRRSVFKFSMGNNLPAYLASDGLGAKVSTWEGPPLAKIWMICFTLDGKCGALGASGLTKPSLA